MKNGNTPIRYDKEGTKNPIAKFLHFKFKSCIYELSSTINFNNIIDVGCGRGEILHFLENKYKNIDNIYGIDLDEEIIMETLVNFQNYKISHQNANNLSFDNNFFDLALVLEVLEHAEDYNSIIKEVKRVTKQYCIFSVPREPLWKILNLARGAHLKYWGNTPGHINHWSSRDFEILLAKHFNILKVVKPIPWTIILCEK